MMLNFKLLKLVLLVLIGTVLIATQSVGGLKCNRVPDGSTAIKSPADGRFLIRIIGNPVKYTPGESYNSEYFELKNLMVNLFNSFMLNLNEKIGKVLKYHFTDFYQQII